MLRVACFDACGCGVCARIMLSCPDARVSEKGWAGCVEEIPADTSRPATDCRPRAAPVRDGHAPGCTGRVLTRAGVVIFPRGRSGSSLNRSRLGGFAAQADPPRGARAPARRLVRSGRPVRASASRDRDRLYGDDLASADALAVRFRPPPALPGPAPLLR